MKKSRKKRPSMRFVMPAIFLMWSWMVTLQPIWKHSRLSFVACMMQALDMAASTIRLTATRYVVMWELSERYVLAAVGETAKL